MKQFRRSYLSIALIFLLSLVTASGQEAPLNCGDCTADWSGPTSRQVCYNNSGGQPCCFVYTYRLRMNCGAQELLLTDIAVIVSSGCTFGRMLQEAFNHLMINNFHNFEPNDDGECSDNWRVTVGSCWRTYEEITTNGQTILHYQACSAEGCCYQHYRVCQDANGNRTWDWLVGGVVTPPQCPATCPDYSCEAIRKLVPKDGSKRVVDPAQSEIVRETVVTPNPTSGIANVTIQANVAGEVDVMIYDVNGKVVLETREQVRSTGEQTTVALDLSNVSSGTYQYVVTMQGSAIAAGQIKLVR